MQHLVRAGTNSAGPSANPLVGGHGVFLEYADGTQVLDASNTGGPLGHAHPAMVEAVEQSARFPVANEGQAWGEREQAAEDLVDTAFAGDSDWIGGVRFGLSGSEVNDIALTLAQAVTDRSPIVARERAYHGLVGLSRDVTVQPQWHGGLSFTAGDVRAPARGVEVRTIDAPDGGAWYSNEAARPGPARSFDDALAGSAAVILDYTQGGHYHDAVYQDRLAAAASDAGALWIADEVVTGLGRTGSWFAFQGGVSRPDLVTLGKPLAGGAAAAGAVVLSKEVLQVLRDAKWQNYSTFRAHPGMIHAVRAHLRVVRDEGLVERAATLGERLGAHLVELAHRHHSVVRVAGRGLHWTVEMQGRDWQEWRSDTDCPQLADHVAAAARSAGVAISTSDEATSFFLAPPLIISDAELLRVVEAVDVGLTAADRVLAQAAVS